MGSVAVCNRILDELEGSQALLNPSVIDLKPEDGGIVSLLVLKCYREKNLMILSWLSTFAERRYLNFPVFSKEF